MTDAASPSDTPGDERTVDARQRLATLLDGKTPQEKYVVAWLIDRLNLERATVLAELIEYRHSR